MKNMIAIYALLMVLSMIFVSCEHKELCYSHPHSTKVSVVFDWSQMPAAYTPGGMRVIFYPRSGGEEIVRDFVGKRGGCVEIPSGVYDVVCFNNDTQRVKRQVSRRLATSRLSARPTICVEGVWLLWKWK